MKSSVSDKNEKLRKKKYNYEIKSYSYELESPNYEIKKVINIGWKVEITLCQGKNS